MKIYISHSTQYNFKEELYEPLKQSKLSNKYDIILPHDDSPQLYNSKDLFKRGCDYVIAEVSTQSLGVGIELGWANLNNIPIMCVYKKGTKLSSSIKAVSKKVIEYEDVQELINCLEGLLS